MTGKAAMTAEVEKGIAAAEAAWTGLEKQATAAAKKMKPDVKKAWDEDAKAAQAALKSAKDTVTNRPGRGQGEARHGARHHREVDEGSHRERDAGAQDAAGQGACARQEAVAGL